MNVIVDVQGGETYELRREDVASGTPTYADVLSAVDLSPHEVSVLVDGRPVPEDQPVETDRLTVVRLVTGG